MRARPNANRTYSQEERKMNLKNTDYKRVWPTRAEIAIDSVKKDFQIAVMSFNTKIKKEKNRWPMLYIFHMDNLNL